jgi:hypothetical protein
MMARLTLLVGICLCTSGFWTCSWNGSSGSVGGAGNGNGNGDGNGGGNGSDDGSGSASTTGVTFDTNLTLRNSTGLATASFVMGEPIRFDFQVKNRTSHAVQLQFGDAQIYDIVVFEQVSSRPLWQWSQGHSFPQIPTTLTYEPGVTQTYSIVWNGVLSDGTQLPVGSFYRARAMLVAISSPTDPLSIEETTSALVSFSVR